MEKVRLLIVDDSEMFVAIMQHALDVDAGIEIVGVASDGAEGVRMAKALRPDIITMDIHMPGMNGIDATADIMRDCPTPIVVLSTDYTERRAFEAMERGAIDVIEKPHLRWTADQARAFCEQLRFLAKVTVVRHQAGARKLAMLDRTRAGRTQPMYVVGLTSSVGGPPAIKAVLQGVEASINACIVIVQHMTVGFTAGMAAWLNASCAVDVRMARSGERLAPGLALIAPDDQHLLIDRGGVVRLSQHDAGTPHRPSADVTFESLAKAYGRRCVGVVLTGMMDDGAIGIGKIHKHGGITIAQDPTDATVGGMPQQAIATDLVQHVCPLSRIAGMIGVAVSRTGE